ncbi:MAG: hypothetical protein ABSC42_06845 [Tepidisphaeraceae bacterium]|jgi:hypothetical protein
MLRFRTLAAFTCILPALLFALGCYETQYPLGSADKATVDPGYVGDFVLPQGDKKPLTITIRNIDNHQCYVEWAGGEDKPDRRVGYAADVNGVTFANLRELTDDGSIDKKFLLMRISLSADHSKLTLRNLKEDFFKDKNVNSSDDLQALIAANLENDQMYDGEPGVATRVVPPAQNSPPN